MRGSFSQRSPLMQILLLIFLALGGLLFFTSVGMMLASLFYPVSVSQLLNSGAMGDEWFTTELLMFLQGFTTLGTFLVPGLLGSYLISERPSEFLGIQSFPSKAFAVVILVLILALSGTTISDALYRLSSSFSWPDWLRFAESWFKGTEDLMMEQMQEFLTMNSTFDFIKVFFLLAILPAIAEETLFRGALQPVFKRWFGNIHLAVWITAALFGMLHQQLNAFLSIMVLGAVLGYLREWSGSLWVAILLHLFNNGLIVVLVYFYDMPYQDVANLTETWQWYYALPGFLIFALCLWVLRRTFLK